MTVDWSALFIIHIIMAVFAAGYLTSPQTLYLLYALNLILIFHVMDLIWKQEHNDFEIIVIPRSARRSFATILPAESASFSPRKETQIRNESMETRPNLFIEHWKEKNLSQPLMFPLDRIAYFNSIFHRCYKQHSVSLRNSHLRQLSRKEHDPTNDFDEPHPRKLVTDFYSSYIHRRAVFYRYRGMHKAGKKQATYKKGDHRREAVSRPEPDGEEDSEMVKTVGTSRAGAMKRRMTYLFRPREYETPDSAKGKSGVQIIWRKLSHFVRGIANAGYTDQEEDSAEIFGQKSNENIFLISRKYLSEKKRNK